MQHFTLPLLLWSSHAGLLLGGCGERGPTTSPASLSTGRTDGMLQEMTMHRPVSCKMLIVDDGPGTALSIALALNTSLQSAVRIAEDGAQAIDIASE